MAIKVRELRPNAICLSNPLRADPADLGRTDLELKSPPPCRIDKLGSKVGENVLNLPVVSQGNRTSDVGL
jgi:hypothetical protein